MNGFGMHLLGYPRPLALLLDSDNVNWRSIDLLAQNDCVIYGQTILGSILLSDEND